MKFVCERCHTKYSIADEKVRGKVLKVRCKTCANVITVRETGATIDDPLSAGPREAPISRSGSINGAQGATGQGATEVDRPSAHSHRRVELPAAALVAPGVSPATPPPKRRPPAPPPFDGVEWYLAVDGAQTGPFPRARLIDKVLATSKGADVHVWNADLDAWKPPKEVPELAAELTRRRRAQTPVPPPPPLRRVTGGVPLFASADEHARSEDGLGSGLLALESEAELAKSWPVQKKNGFTPAVAAGAGLASAGVVDFGLRDLLGGGDTGATPLPSTDMLAKAFSTGVSPAPSMFSAPPAVAALPDVGTGAVATGRGRQIRLLLGALGVVVVLCGIVVVWMFRRPGTPTVVVGEPVATKPVSADFASGEKSAQDEAHLQKPSPPPTVSPPSAVETKPTVARVEPPQKPGKGKSRRRSTTPPPVSATGVPLTAEQVDAASRFGETFGRDVKLPTATANAAHIMPAQADISRVINNNRQGIQTCYQRALLRDNTLTHGKVTVRVSIGLSGKVKSVSLDAPVQFRALEPCIRDVMSRWAFPPSSEEYGTEFPVVLQGNQ
jgi:predicted Zn finger-like uncharacterized protein